MKEGCKEVMEEGRTYVRKDGGKDSVKKTRKE